MGDATRRGDVEAGSALARRAPPESGPRLIVAESATVAAVMEPEFLTAEEAAALLRLTVQTVRAYVREDKIPGARFVGKEIRVHRPTLVASFVGSPDGRPWRRRSR